MSLITLTKTYTCSDDCEMGGCPSHTARLEYQSVSDAYYFESRGVKKYFERGELGSFISLLKELQERRADSVKIIELLGNPE